MRLLSVNIGQRTTQPKGNELEITGINKLPAQGLVELTRLGIPGDFIADTANHGGPDQAVYLYGERDYEWWSKDLGRPLPPGTFGENLTIGELESAHFGVGDRLEVGSAILEVTAPRIPCSTLARRMGDPMFVKRYRHAERPGLYCRVISVGTIKEGDEVRLEAFGGEAVKVIDIFREHYALEKNEAILRRFLAAPIAARARVDVTKRLEKMLSRS